MALPASFAVAGRVMVWADPAETVGGTLAVATTRARLAVWLKVVVLPVTIRVAVPSGVLPVEFTVSVVAPDVVIEDGLNDAVTPAGMPLALMVTAPLNPPAGATVTV